MSKTFFITKRDCTMSDFDRKLINCDSMIKTLTQIKVKNDLVKSKDSPTQNKS